MIHVLTRCRIASPARNSFVSDIVMAVISLAHILNLHVVAEGVESEEQHRFLLENGCDEVQGYHFGNPMSFDGFAQA